MIKIPFGKPIVSSKEYRAVLNVLKNRSLSLIDGENVKKLEKTVSIGIKTNNEIIIDIKNQIFKFFDILRTYILI